LHAYATLKHRHGVAHAVCSRSALSEATNLQVADIDSQRMLLNIRQGKGAKQRLVPLSAAVVAGTPQLTEAGAAGDVSILGQDAGCALGDDTVQKALQAGGGLGPHPQTRHAAHTAHSYATGLLEGGSDLLTIGRLLGHRAFTTTMIYLHVRRPHLESTPVHSTWPLSANVRVDRSEPRVDSERAATRSASRSEAVRPDQPPSDPANPSA